VAVVPPTEGQGAGPGLLVLVAGRFDQSRIEKLMVDAGARTESYRGANIIQTGDAGDAFSLAFINPGLVVVGARTLLGQTIDLQVDGGQAVTDRPELMALVRSFGERDAWAVGRVDTLTSQAPMPRDFSAQLPALTVFGADATVISGGGVSGSVQVEAATEEAARNLHEMVQGVVALARLQAASTPGLKQFLDSLTLGGVERTISLSFSAPPGLLQELAPLRP
jgi:hypothetical protein